MPAVVQTHPKVFRKKKERAAKAKSNLKKQQNFGKFNIFKNFNIPSIWAHIWHRKKYANSQQITQKWKVGTKLEWVHTKTFKHHQKYYRTCSEVPEIAWVISKNSIFQKVNYFVFVRQGATAEDHGRSWKMRKFWKTRLVAIPHPSELISRPGVQVEWKPLWIFIP